MVLCYFEKNLEIYLLNTLKPQYVFTLLGPSNIYASRFLGFSVYVSNTTNKLDGVLCFKDTNFTLITIPAVFATTCFGHGQYVIYYNERKGGGSDPPYYSPYVYSEICELEVYGESIQFKNLQSVTFSTLQFLHTVYYIFPVNIILHHIKTF